MKKPSFKGGFLIFYGTISFFYAQKLLLATGSSSYYNSYAKKLSVFFLRSETTGANVLITYSAFGVHSFYFVNVGFPTPSGFYITVAYFVAAYLRLAANTANSAHW